MGSDLMPSVPYYPDVLGLFYHTSLCKNGKPRRNPARNQIDCNHQYKYKNYIRDSRSYGGIRTDTDHKLALAKIVMKCQNAQTQRKNKLNTENTRLRNPI